MLDRPDKLNALSVAVFEELRQHVIDISAGSGVGCVVLRGAGRCFSAGHDLSDIASGAKVRPPSWHSETLRMLEQLPVPVVAAVHGHCYTGALEVALAADFIIAADDARFGDTHAKFALTPVWGMSQRLPRRVGAATAKRLMFTADMIDAAEAVRIGLAEYAVPREQFETEIDAMASRITANSLFTHGVVKHLLENTDAYPLDAGLARESVDSGAFGPDMNERIAAFTTRVR
jgi:enoyl-CoA hydratase/carnithine racemase